MKPLRKALIPVAGLGTRFLPASKTVPKELFPLVDAPILLHIVEEAVAAGIEDIVLVTGRGKDAIEDFFDVSYELEDILMKKDQSHLLDRLYNVRANANIISIRQGKALGLGHAVLCGQPIIGNEAFAVLLGDEILIPPKDVPPVTKQLSQVFESNALSTVAIMEVPTEDVAKYGIVDASLDSNLSHQHDIPAEIYRVSSVVEKPTPESAPSRLALPGRYIFTAEIFAHLKNVSPGVIGEIQLTDGMTQLAITEGLLATPFNAQRFDAGSRLGYLQANIAIGLNHPEIGEDLTHYLRNLKL